MDSNIMVIQYFKDEKAETAEYFKYKEIFSVKVF